MSPNPEDEPPHREQDFWDNIFRKKPSPHNRQGPVPPPKIRNDPWQSVSALQLGLQPRSFSDLHTERMYLVEMLQQHDKRATELFMRLPEIEEQIQRAETPDALRRAKKLRGWLKHRIEDTVEEEKKVLARLGELHVEIQCRERWSRVNRERELRNLESPQQNLAFTGLPTTLQPSPPQPYPHMNPPYPEPDWSYPTYGYAETLDMHHDEHVSNFETHPEYDWEDGISPSWIHSPEYYLGPELFELEGTEIEDASRNTSGSLPWSFDTIPRPKPTKSRSMPSLSHKWSG